MKKIVYIVPILLLVCFGCQNSDSTDNVASKNKEIQTPANNNDIDTFNNIAKKHKSEFPANFSRDKLFDLSVIYDDNKDSLEINRKYYGKDYEKALQDYLDKLDVDTLKDGIIYCYFDKRVNPYESKCTKIVTEFCKSNDIDLFIQYPLSSAIIINWIVKSSKTKYKSE